MKHVDSIKEVLGFDVKVLTYEGKEKIIRFTDFIDTERLGASLSIDRDICCLYPTWSGADNPVCTIELKVRCGGYSMDFIGKDQTRE